LERTVDESKIFMGINVQNAADPFSSPEWKDVYSALYDGCVGCKIKLNGNVPISTDNQKHNRKDSDTNIPLKRICCTRHRPYTPLSTLPNTLTQEQLSTYRPATVHNDYKNSRTHGHIEKKRKCHTNLPLESSERCSFSFIVGYDITAGFFIDLHNSDLYHNGHIFDPNWQVRKPSKNTDGKLLESLKNLRAVNASGSIAMRVFHDNSACVLSRHQIRFITRLAAPGGKVSIDGGSRYNPQELITFFRDKKISYVALLHGKVNSINSAFHELYDGKENSVAISTPTGDDEMNSFCNNERSTLPDNDITLFAAIAWTSMHEKKIFIKYPFILNIDATAQTNSEQRPLVTCNVRTMDGNWIPVLRALLPSEQSWSYRWLFSEAFSILLGSDWVYNSNLAITDGDSQEITQFNYCRNEASKTNTLRRNVVQLRRCSVHIISKSLEKYGPMISRTAVGTRRSGPLYEAYKHIMETVKNWMFSWCDPHKCETETEFQVSKSLLMKYILSDHVSTALGNEKNVLISCINEHILCHATVVAHYAYNNVRSYGAHTNNGAEGNHYAYKHSAVAVSTKDSLFNMASKLCSGSEIKILSQQQRANTTETWISSESAGMLHRTALYEIANAQVRSSQYISQRVEVNKWLVKQKNEMNKSTRKTPIPSFHRVRVVKMSLEDGSMSCSCMNFECFGVGCTHIVTAIKSVNYNYEGYSYTDVSCPWWTLYGTTPVDDDSDMWHKLMELRSNDIKGPVMPHFHDVILNVNDIVPKSAGPSFTCSNYSFDEIKDATKGNEVMGYSQVTNVEVAREVDADSSKCEEFGPSMDDNDAELSADERISTSHDLQIQGERKKETPFSRLYGDFQHLCSSLNLLSVEDAETEIAFWKESMNTKATQYKPKLQKTSDKQMIVSSNVPYKEKQRMISKGCF
jgi:hypothetical protein